MAVSRDIPPSIPAPAPWVCKVHNPYDVIEHHRGEYARGLVHTQTVESYREARQLASAKREAFCSLGRNTNAPNKSALGFLFGTHGI